MKALSEFYNRLLPELPGCTTSMVDLHLVDVAREYCTETRAWRLPLELQLPVGEDTTALFPPSSGTQLVAPLSLRVNDQLWWAASDPNPPPRASLDVPRFARFMAHQPPFAVDLDRSSITFTTRPDGPAEMLVAATPAYAAAQLPDFLLLDLQHQRAIVHGVLSRLKAMGGKPWTDLSMAAYHDSEWSAGKNLAGVRAAKGNAGGLLRTTRTTI